MILNNVKKICFKEMKESLSDKQFITTILFYVILNLVVPILMVFMNDDVSNFMDTSLGKMLIIIFIGYGFYLMFYISINHKFMNDSLLNTFYPLLPLPMSLKEICLGKLLSIVGLTYPFTLMVLTIISIVYFSLNVFNIMQTSLMFLFVLFLLVPLLVFTYNTFGIWLFLVFKNKSVLLISNMIIVLGFVLIPMGLHKVLPDLSFLKTVNMNFAILAMLIVILIVLFITIKLIGRLDKEKLIT
ncbi:MAG: hypothetical protein LBC39_03150 [Methanobrevibacter sp.]|jgi:hypothetical protein|nr:hypothetical protein [Candidatus Methanovirga aequatorialis]